MGLNDTPGASRFTIGIFGKRNAGKSSLINSLTGQSIALASSVPGTTTDPVYKAMEILPIGPVMLIDTAGLDDEGELGAQRVEKSMEALRKCHLVVFVAHSDTKPDPDPEDSTWNLTNYLDPEENAFLDQMDRRKIPYVVAVNKMGEATDRLNEKLGRKNLVFTDADLKLGMDRLKKALIDNSDRTEEEPGLTDGLIQAGDLAVLVTPIDTAAPKGRMILPQQQVLRDILDKGAYAVVTREGELDQALRALGKKPRVVITDSQAFRLVDKIVPDDMELTSFSILYARQKGRLEDMVKAARVLGDLQPGDKVLIAEACTHHRQKDDIGTVKLPRLIRSIQPEADIQMHSGHSFPENIRDYKVIVHCGACMLNRPEVQYRLDYAEEKGVPMTNYGLTIAYCTGILKRAVAPFGILL